MMFRLLGDPERVKFGGGATVRFRVVVLIKLPEMPVIVTGTVPVAAVLIAVSVNVLMLVPGFGLNDAVTPLGRPNADKLTGPSKPFCGFTVIVLLPLPPCVTVRLLGDADRPKLPTEFTVSAIVVECVKLSEVPVIVTTTVPIGAALVAVKVNVLVALAGFGLKDALTPPGRPDTDKRTFPLNPFRPVTVTVIAPLPPCVRIKLLGDAAKE